MNTEDEELDRSERAAKTVAARLAIEEQVWLRARTPARPSRPPRTGASAAGAPQRAHARRAALVHREQQAAACAGNSKAVEPLSRVLTRRPQSFALRGISLTDPDLVKSVTGTLARTRFEHVTLSDCRMTAPVLKRCAPPRKARPPSPLGGGVHSVLESLWGVPSTLDLSGNDFGDAGASLIADW
jgi:hypothetical protein